MSSVNQQHGDQVAIAPASTSRLGGGPLDEALASIRGGRGAVSDRINKLIAFPSALPAPDDASVTSLRCSFDANDQAQLTVEYQTGVTLDGLADLHRSTLSAAGLELDEPISTDPHLVVVRGRSLSSDVYSPNPHSQVAAHASDTIVDTHICIDEHEGRRRVQVALSYSGYDTAETLAAYADWHDQLLLFDSATVERFEISTAETRFTPSFTALYTTGYRVSDATINALRPGLEHQLCQAGWSWLEPEPGVLFLTGAFDAEVHLRQQGADAVIELVGEFDVAIEPAT